MAKFLVDESTGKRLALILISEGYDVLFVGDWKRGATDEEVLSKAYSEDRIIITDDKDFGELIFRLSRKSRGVILIRMASISPATRSKMLIKILETIEVIDKFIVIRDGAVKVAKLQ